jgi:hypothetical protein
VKIVRSVVAVLAGFGVFLIFVRILTAFTGGLENGGPVVNFLMLSVCWSVAGAVLGGYTTARLAGAHEFPHSAALGLLMVVVSLVSMRQEHIAQPGWYQTTVAGCGPISAMIGAAIRLLTKTGTPRQRRAGDSHRPA